jgi:hypothetical protein
MATETEVVWKETITTKKKTTSKTITTKNKQTSISVHIHFVLSQKICTFTRRKKREYKKVLGKKNCKIFRLANNIVTKKSKKLIEVPCFYGVRALRINGLWTIAGGSHSLLLLVLGVCVIAWLGFKSQHVAQ